MTPLGRQHSHGSDWLKVAGIHAAVASGVASACVAFVLLMGGGVTWLVPIALVASWVAAWLATGFAVLVVWAVTRSAIATTLLAAGPVTMAIVIGRQTVGLRFLIAAWAALMVCNAIVASLLVMSGLHERSPLPRLRIAAVYLIAFLCLVGVESVVLWGAGVKTGDGPIPTLSRSQLARAIGERDMQRRWEAQKRIATQYPELLAELAVSCSDKTRSGAIQAIVRYRPQAALDRLHEWASNESPDRERAAIALGEIEAKAEERKRGQGASPNE